MASSRFGVPAPVTAGKGYCCNDVFIALDYGEWKSDDGFRRLYGPDGLGLVGDAIRGGLPSGGTANNRHPNQSSPENRIYYDSWGPFQMKQGYWDDTGVTKHPVTGRPVTRADILTDRELAKFVVCWWMMRYTSRFNGDPPHGGPSQLNSPTYGQLGNVGPDWVTMPPTGPPTLGNPPASPWQPRLVPRALSGRFVSQMVERFQKCKGTDADMERVVRMHNGGPRPGPPFNNVNTAYWNRAYNGLRREGRTFGAINGSNNPNDGPAGVGRPAPSNW